MLPINMSHSTSSTKRMRYERNIDSRYKKWKRNANKHAGSCKSGKANIPHTDKKWDN